MPEPIRTAEPPVQHRGRQHTKQPQRGRAFIGRRNIATSPTPSQSSNPLIYCIIVYGIRRRHQTSTLNRVSGFLPVAQQTIGGIRCREADIGTGYGLESGWGRVLLEGASEKRWKLQRFQPGHCVGAIPALEMTRKGLADAVEDGTCIRPSTVETSLLATGRERGRELKRLISTSCAAACHRGDPGCRRRPGPSRQSRPGCA